MCVTPIKFEWHFSDRLTFSNTRGRLVIKDINYVALPLRTPEMLSSLSLFNAHLALFCPKDDTFTVTHTPIGVNRH